MEENLDNAFYQNNIVPTIDCKATAALIENSGSIDHSKKSTDHVKNSLSEQIMDRNQNATLIDIKEQLIKSTNNNLTTINSTSIKSTTNKSTEFKLNEFNNDSIDKREQQKQINEFSNGDNEQLNMNNGKFKKNEDQFNEISSNDLNLNKKNCTNLKTTNDSKSSNGNPGKLI